MTLTGAKLNQLFNIGALHALYRADGTWYHQLKRFPAVLFDNKGYLVVPSKFDYDSNKLLKRKKHLHIKDGINKILGYQPFSDEQMNILETGTLPTSGKKQSTPIQKPFSFTHSGTFDIIEVVRGETRKPLKEIRQLHREICKGLYTKLVKEYGVENVGCDCHTGNRTYIDMLGKKKSSFYFYEVKTYPDLRRTIREAFGQLMEYAFWNFTEEVNELIIVSHIPPDKTVRNYLSTLRTKFSIPIFYQHFDVVKQQLSRKI